MLYPGDGDSAKLSAIAGNVVLPEPDIAHVSGSTDDNSNDSHQ